MIMDGVLDRRKNDLTKVDLVVYTLLTVFFVINLLTFDYSGANWAVILTFFLLGAFFYFRIITARKNISLYRVYYIFCFVFMFYAPLQQYLSGTVFQSGNGWTLTYSDTDYLRANGLLIAFTALFELGYRLTKNKETTRRPYILVPTARMQVLLFLGSLLSIGILAVSGNLFGRVGYGVSNANIGSQINNILRFFPVACFIVTFLQNKELVYKQKWSIVIYGLETFLVFFPFYGSISRFLLFGVYLMIITLFFVNTKHKSLFFLLCVIGFFLVFSSFNYFKTHTVVDMSGFALSITNFNMMDYDAYQMLMATMHYVKENGSAMGRNILAVIFNFVPRSIWTSKMYPTGQIVAEYFGTWFTNLSCPIAAECYFAFGGFGIVIGAPIVGLLLKKVDGFSISDSFFKCGLFHLLSGLLMFILRGALLPTIAYTLALSISLGMVCIVVRFFSLRVTATTLQDIDDANGLAELSRSYGAQKRKPAWRKQ